MFKRRKPRSYSQLATEMIYPRGGWRRASQYVMHRIRRLPDQPQRIARGFAAGIIVSFTPLFGFHFMTFLALGIHFLPTVVCWAALFPLERLLPQRFREPTPAVA